jgi:hypothetical protein
MCHVDPLVFVRRPKVWLILACESNAFEGYAVGRPRLLENSTTIAKFVNPTGDDVISGAFLDDLRTY